MKRQRVCLLFLVLLITGGSAVLVAERRDRPPPQQQARPQAGTDLRLTGHVVEIHAPRVFTVRERGGAERELVVLAPRALRPGFLKATVTVEGLVRRLTQAEVDRIARFDEIDQATRDRLLRGPVLVASSVLAIGRDDTAPVVEEPEPPVAVERRQPPIARVEVEERPLTVRTGMMVANLDVFAGRQVRVLNGRIVGILEPSAFLIEPATSYLKAMGQRDRVLVLLRSAPLRAPAELIVGSIVSVTGTVRTLVGVQITREVPWPGSLRPEVVDRLEVRAAILATSVQTRDGVELSETSPAAAVR